MLAKLAVGTAAVAVGIVYLRFVDRGEVICSAS